MIATRRRFVRVGAAAALALPGLVQAADGYIGLSVSVEGEGFFLNPILKVVKIAKVAPDSPAAQAGLREGELILEVEGRKVVGARASELKPYLEREVGQVLRFVIQGADGVQRAVSVTPGPKPR